MTAYVISEVETRNQALMERYRSLAETTIAQYGGRYIVRGASIETVEGAPSDRRLVIVEFPSMEAARAWYGSPEYAAALAVRRDALQRRLIFVEGVGSP
jgi:uncharacterized protein (DUF1330 family)